MKRDCKNKPVKKEVESSLGKEVETKDMYVATTYMAQSNKDIWFVDTCASYHMIAYRHWFCEYEEYNSGDVMLGDDLTIQIIGRDKVKLRMSNGTIKTLSDVMHIPSMSKNLLSVGIMADSGFNFSCDKDSCKMTRGSIVIA